MLEAPVLLRNRAVGRGLKRLNGEQDRTFQRESSFMFWHQIWFFQLQFYTDLRRFTRAVPNRKLRRHSYEKTRRNAKKHRKRESSTYIRHIQSPLEETEERHSVSGQDSKMSKTRGEAVEPQGEDVVLQVMRLANSQFQRQMYSECHKLFTHAIEYAQSFDQKSLRKLRLSYNLSERPSYLKPDQQLHHPKLATLLDSRAATLEKQKKFTEALVDAKEEIKIEPYNAKGYIRCTRLYQIVKNDGKALEWATYGIKKIEHGMKEYKLKANERTLEILKHLKDELKLRLQAQKKAKEDIGKSRLIPISSVGGPLLKKTKISEKSMDIIKLLPVEVVEKVMRNLSLREVTKCFRVNKQWHEIISQMSLYNSVRMTRMIGTNDIRSCFRLIHKSKAHLVKKYVNSVIISSMRRTDEKAIATYVIFRSNVMISERLDLSFVDMSMQQIVDLIKNNAQSRRTLKHLKHLKLRCVYSPTYEEVLLTLLPNLESITIIPSFDHAKLSVPSNYTPPSQTFTSLKSLYIVGDLKKKYPSIPFHNMFRIDSERLPNLIALTIVGCDFEKLNNTNGVFNFLQKLPRLQSLIFENNKSLTFRTILKNHDSLNFPNLRKFAMREREIKYVEGLQIYDEIYLTNIFSQLQILDLTGSCISFLGLSKILKICGHNLRQLSIGFCSNINFRTGPFCQLPHGGFFEFHDLMRWCPVLEVLYLNQSTDFCDYSLSEMIEAIRAHDSMHSLKVIDLSFNYGLSGYKLIELVKLRPLQLLKLHGIDVSPATIKFMERGFVGRIESQIDKQSWKEYGVTSYDPLN